jgi:dihydrofolate reductase
MIKAILACDQEWGIGKNGALPWPHNSADLKWFKQHTNNSTIVMGRKTWESLPVKPLPNRRHIVCSTKDISCFPGADAVMNINAITQTLPYLSGGDKWIIGGAQLIEQCLGVIDEFYLSRIEGVYNCDTFLPADLIMDNFNLYDAEETDSDLYIEKWARK